jgi:hypothetical protein
MKTGLLILIGALMLSSSGYISTRWLSGGQRAAECAACNIATLGTADALGWMRQDFALTDEEFAKVCALHDAYRPHCDVMCERMRTATARVSASLNDQPRMNAETEAALREYDEARAECQRDALNHVLDTASVMKPAAGRAFVQKVLPHLLISRQHISDVQQ